MSSTYSFFIRASAPFTLYLLSNTTAMAAVIFNSAIVSTASSVDVSSPTSHAFVNSIGSDSAIAFLPSIVAFSDATARVREATATASSVGEALFFRDGAAGSFVNSSDLSASVSGPGGIAYAGAGIYNYRYLFSVTDTARITVGYRINQNSPSGAYILVNGPETFGGIVNNGTSGSMSGVLTAGNYVMTFDSISAVSSFPNYLIQSGIGTQSTAGTDEYTFDITSGVPQPSTWVLMFLGFGVVGSALRRKKIHAVIPGTQY
jgi:hypothetical protein